MTYLITQIFLCLLLAALVGFIIGWALRSMTCQKKIAELEAVWADRLAAASAGGAPVQRDDLKRIEGIGPKIEKMLNDELIYTWAELAAAPVDRLKSILRKGGDRYKMHDPTSWPDQAKLAAQGRWKELEELQDILQGGREG
jgi:predicted flap endonuclease-1-like 5' DNA nuclease